LEILEGNTLAKCLFEKYSANSDQWKFQISVQEKHNSFFDAIVSSPDEVWQLKIDSIYKPAPLIIGAKVDLEPTKFRSDVDQVSFGYRRLDTIKLEKILTDPNGGMRDLNMYLGSLLRSTSPEIPKPENNYAYGPFVFTSSNLTNVDKCQKEVSDKLANSLRDKLRSLYSSYG